MSSQTISIQTSISDNYQTYIPKNVRQSLGITKSKKLNWLIVDDHVEVSRAKTQEELIKSLRGVAKGLYDKYGGGEKWLKEERRKAWPEER